MCFLESSERKGWSCEGGREKGAGGVEERGFAELGEALNTDFEGLPFDFGGMMKVIICCCGSAS